jgi:hypothetical protein
LEEVTHLAAYAATVLKSSRGHNENGACPQFVAVIALREASIHIPQGRHAVVRFHFLRADSSRLVVLLRS